MVDAKLRRRLEAAEAQAAPLVAEMRGPGTQPTGGRRLARVARSGRRDALADEA